MSKRKRRVTVKVPVSPNHRRGDGRPKGTFKKYRFEETCLGFFLKYELPLVYDIIIRQAPASQGQNPEPSVMLIKTVCAASRDPALRKPRFRKLIEKYERQGLYCRRAKRLTPQMEAYYEKLRRKKLEKFIQENRLRIDYALREVKTLKTSGEK